MEKHPSRYFSSSSSNEQLAQGPLAYVQSTQQSEQPSQKLVLQQSNTSAASQAAARATQRRGAQFGSVMSRMLFFGIGLASTLYYTDELIGAQKQERINLQRALNDINENLLNNSMSKVKNINETTSAYEWFKYLLSDRNISAFKIQSFWRERKTRKQYLALKRRKAYEIKIYATSLAIDIQQQTDQERIKFILDAMKLRYKWLDLNDPDVKSVETLKEIEQYGGVRNIPIVIINGNYIGGIQELQDLVDEGVLMPIIEKQYEDQCLLCQVTRESIEDNICKFCWKKYMFFVKRFDEAYRDLFANYDNLEQQMMFQNQNFDNSTPVEKLNKTSELQKVHKIQREINQRERREDKRQRSNSTINKQRSAQRRQMQELE